MQLVALSTLGVVLGAILALCVGRSLQRPIMDLFDYVERTGQVPAQSLEAQHIRRQTKEGPRWFETSALKLENEEGTFDGLALIATPLRETTG